MGLISHDSDIHPEILPENSESQVAGFSPLEEESTKNTIEENAIVSVTNASHAHPKKILPRNQSREVNLQKIVVDSIKDQDEQTSRFLLELGKNIRYDEESYKALVKTLRKQAKEEYDKAIPSGVYSKAEKNKIISNMVNQRVELLLKGIEFNDFKDETTEIGKVLKQLSEACFEIPQKGEDKQLKKSDIHLSEVQINQKKYKVDISVFDKSITLSPLDKKMGQSISVNYSKKSKNLSQDDEKKQFNNAIRDLILQAMFDGGKKGIQKEVRRQISGNLTEAIQFMFSGVAHGVRVLNTVVEYGEPVYTVLDGVYSVVEHAHKTSHHTHASEGVVDITANQTATMQTLKNALGGTVVAIGGIQAIDGAIDIQKGGRNYHEAKVFLKTYADLKERVARGHVNVHVLDMQALDAIEKQIRLKLLLDIGEGGSKIITGAVNILAGVGTLTGSTVIAAAGFGTGGGLVITGAGMHAFYNGYKLMKIDERIDETQKIRRELAKESISYNDAEIAKKFVEMEIKLLKSRKKDLHVVLAGDAMMVTGGCLLVAAAVAGSGSCGIAAGAILGGSAAALLSYEGYQLWQKHKFKKLQTQLKIEDATNFKEAMKKSKDPNASFTHMQSVSGVILELSRRIKKEQAAKALDKSAPTPLSNHIVIEYMKMEPNTFIQMMDGMLEVFLEEAIPVPSLQLEAPKPEITATLVIPFLTESDSSSESSIMI